MLPRMSVDEGNGTSETDARAPCAPFASLEAATQALWTDPPRLEGLTKEPAFQSLVAAYLGTYPDAGSRSTMEFALREAVRRLGLGAQNGLSWQDAASRLHRAARATTTRRLHLCPLDWAGNIPPLTFGPNAVRSFTHDELGRLLTEASASPTDALRGVDLAKLSQFRWLVVSETATVSKEPGRRILPGLFFNLGRDFGQIEPHRRRLPEAVERALFCLLTIPWEDLTRESGADWRPFQIPWAWTLEDDLFTRAASPPDPASLTWDYRYYDHADGELEEIEVPLEVRLDDGGTYSATTWMDDKAWRRFERAEASALLTPPVIHFYLAGLSADGIDEFLAHVATIEASLGQAADHRNYQTLPDGSRRATALTAWRLRQLLNDPEASKTFRVLFKLRSRYVHGESMDPISSIDRTIARRLARRCVCALIGVASSYPAPTDRSAWLDSLIPPPPPHPDTPAKARMRRP